MSRMFEVIPQAPHAIVSSHPLLESSRNMAKALRDDPNNDCEGTYTY